MRAMFILLMCLLAQIAYSQDSNLMTSDLEIRIKHVPGRNYDDFLGAYTIVSVCSDKIEIRTHRKKFFVITDKDSVATVRGLISDLFIEKNTPVILSKIERDENWKIADYYPTGFSIYVPKSKTQSLNVIAAYSYDTWRYVYSEKFRTLMSLLDK